MWENSKGMDLYKEQEDEKDMWEFMRFMSVWTGGGGRVGGCSRAQFDLSVDFALILSTFRKSHRTPTAARLSEAA